LPGAVEQREGLPGILVNVIASGYLDVGSAVMCHGSVGCKRMWA
jgi:MOSC domain-containing protein YiiM